MSTGGIAAVSAAAAVVALCALAAYAIHRGRKITLTLLSVSILPPALPKPRAAAQVPAVTEAAVTALPERRTA